MSTVVVTGGAGFVGSHVAELLRDRGHDVTVVDDLSSGKRENVPEGCRLVELDITDAPARRARDRRRSVRLPPGRPGERDRLRRRSPTATWRSTSPGR